MNEEKRLKRRQRLMDNKAYQTMEGLTRYMDRYYLDALIGVIPGWGDAIALLCVVPFVYFSSRVIKSLPLTLAVLNNALRDVLLGMQVGACYTLEVKKKGMGPEAITASGPPQT